MNNGEIIGKVHDSMYRQIQKDGVAAPVQVLLDVGILSKEDHDNWRFGKVDYLERVCRANLHTLSFIMKQVRGYAKSNGLKPSWTMYKRWGRKGKETVALRFSKTGQDAVERAYATHYVSPRLTEQRREEKRSARDGADARADGI